MPGTRPGKGFFHCGALGAPCCVAEKLWPKCVKTPDMCMADLRSFSWSCGLRCLFVQCTRLEGVQTMSLINLLVAARTAIASWRQRQRAHVELMGLDDRSLA